MLGIPSNVLPLFIMGTVVLVFGIRGLYHYSSVKTPLTLYYALSGVFFGVSGIFYSLPFAVTNNDTVLKLAITLADTLYYFAILVQLRIIWYLGLKKKISFMWLLVPALVLIIISFGFDIVNRLNTVYYVAGGVANFSTAQVSLYLLAFLSLSIIAVGILTLLQVRHLQHKSAKIRLTTLGVMFLLAGLTVEYNFLFLQGNNTSSAIFIGYAVAIAGFVMGLFFVGRRTPAQ